MKYTAMLLFLILFLAVALPAEASLCRNYNGNSICIVSIKRSAKYYWRYRAAVSVNGVARPIEIYNCRVREASPTENRVKIRQDRSVVPFEPDGAGEFICNILKKN